MTPNSNAGSQLTVDGVKPSTPPARAGGETTPVPESAKPKDENTNESVIANGSKGPHDAPASPQVHTQQYQQGYAPQLTPQPGAGYYFLGNHQVTPEPPSPATPGYDVNSFLQHQAAALGVHHGNPFGSGQYGGIPQPPLSPSRVGMTGGLIPPASPLFPRAAGNPVGSFDQQNQLDSSVFQRIQGQTPASPSMPYMASPSLGPSNGATFGGVYQGYAANTGTYASVLSGAQGGEPSASPDDRGWGDRNNFQQSQYPQASPRQGQVPSPYPPSRTNNRSYSFDESMLPPSVLDQQDQTSAPYSPYSTNQGASGNTLFAQQPWGYGVSGDMYNPPQSPLQPRQSPHMQPHFPGGHPGMGPPPMHHMGAYPGQQPMPPYYPATSPGPPIQTTASNKGPDGANLFIFHIPNHFTNLDMYRLFCQYGNLLSVRIMVEKDTGRSRGFGFVSYDSPESAALAIKELNGFAIGNKRLKVQHKQIRGDQPRNSFNEQHAGDPSFMPRPGLPQGGPPPTMGGMNPALPWYEAAPPGTEEQQQHQTHEIEAVADDTTGTPGLTSISGDQSSAGLSPLANMDPLRSALPDVAGHAGTVE